MANNSINFNIGFKVNDSGLKQVRTSIDQLRNLTGKQIELINPATTGKGIEFLHQATVEVGKFEAAMTQAYNVKLGTVNLERFNEELTKNGTSIQNFKEKMLQLGPTGEQVYAKMASGLMNVKYETVETTTLMDKLGDSLRRSLLTFASINIINKVKGSIGEAYGYVKNLDTSLNDIRIVTGKSADEMDRFAESANKAAAKLGKATTDYTKASTIFYQQGLSDTEVQSRTEVALKVSNTTGADTSKAADQLTAIWNGFNVGAEDAEKSIDVIAAVAANTASNLDEMATAMSKVASMANSMGVSEEQLASQISTVIAVTRQAPESVGTAFKTIYARIADIKAGSEDAEISLGNYSGQLAALGINVLDTAGNLKDMGQIIEDVGTSWGNYSKEQQVAIAGIMGGQRQVNQLRALFDNWDKYTETMKIAADAEGTLQQQQDTYMESAEGQLQMLRTEWEGVLDSLLKAEDIVNVAKKIQPILVNLEKLIDAFGGGIGILQKFSPLLISIVSPQISQGIGKMVNSFQAAQTNMKLAQQQADVWNATMRDTEFTDKYAQSIKNLGADYVSLMNTMSAEQRNDFQASMQRFIDTTAPAVKQSLADVNAAFESLKNEARGALQIGENDDLNSAIQKCENLEKSINILDTTFTETSNKMKSGFRLNDAIDSVVQEVESLGQVYGTLPEPIDKVRQAILHYQGVMKDANHTTEEAKQAKEAIMIAYENAQEYVNEDRQGLVRYIETLKDYIRNVQNADESLQQMNNTTRQLNTEQMVSSFVAVTQGLISIVNAIQQIKNLGKIWSNEDLTTGEKLAQTLTTIGSALVITIPSIKSMSTALKVLTKEETLNTIQTTINNLAKVFGTELTIKDTAVTAENTVVTGAHTSALVADTAAQTANNVARVSAIGSLKALGTAAAATSKTLILGTGKILGLIAPLLPAIAAITVAVGSFYVLYKRLNQDHQKDMEKEYEKIQEEIDAVNNLKNSLDDYYKSQKEYKETLSNLVKGTDEYNKALDEQEQKVKELIKEHTKLRAAVTYDENGVMTLNEEEANKILKEEQDKVGKDERKALKKGLIDKPILDKEAKNWSQEEVLNYNKSLLKDYADSISEYQDVESQTMLTLISKWQQEGIKATDIAFELEHNIDYIQQELNRIEQTQKRIKNFDYQAVLSGDRSSVSKQTASEILNASDEQIADMLGLDISEEFQEYHSVDYEENIKEIQDFRAQMALAYSEASNFPDAFNTEKWNNLAPNIKNKFKNIAGTIDDSFISQLGSGLEELKSSTTIDIDEFTTDLANLDFTQGVTGLEEFREKYGELNTELEGYITEQIRYNTIAQSSSVAIQNLVDAMSKVSQMKFGDTLSEKDYGELINKFKGLEKYFVKIGDKYSYMAKNSSQVTKEIKKSFDEQMNKMNQYSEKIKEVGIRVEGLQDALKGINKMPDQFNGNNYQVNTTNQSIKENEDLMNIVSEQTQIKIGDLEKLLSTSAQDLTEEQTAQLQGVYEILDKIQNWSITSTDSLDLQKQYIAAVITSEEELYQAVHEGKISWEAASQMRLYAREKELELTKQLIEKENELEKSRIESERKGIQDEITEAEEMMNKTEGEEYNKWLEKRNELREQDKKKLQEEIDLQNKELDNLTKQKNIIDTLSDNGIITGIDSSTDAKIKAGQLANRIAQGKKFTEEELEEWGINPQEYKDIILPIIEDIANKTYDIEDANRELKDLYKEQAISAQEILEITKKTNEIAISRNQRELGKIQDRKAHASGQEYLQLREEERQKKNEYSYLLGEQKIWTEDDIRKRKAELENKPWATFDASGNVSIQQVTNEKGEVIHPTNEELDRVKAYQDARKEALDLEYQIEDIHKEQYITIDKTANEQRAIANNQKEINKLEKEATYLTGDALLNNLKKQNELREKNAKLQAKQLADSKLELTEAQNTLQSIVGGKVKIDFDISGGVANIEEILETFNGTEFAEEVQNWINKVNDCADATQELEEAFLDFAEKLDSNYDEENRIKGLERQKDVLETQRKNVEKGSPEYERYTKELQDLDKQIRDLRQRELEEYESNELEKAKTVLEDALKNVKLKNWQPDYDKNQVITNVEDLQKEISPEDWEKISEGNLSEEELTALIKKYGDIKTLQEAILDYNEKQNAALDQQNDIAKDNITKWDEKRELLKDTHDWTQKNLEESKSILELEGSGLYGDDKITNLEKQADIQHQITEDAKQQVKDQEDYIEQLKAAGANESVIAQAEADLKDYKKSALEAEKKEQDEIKKILQEKVKIVEEEIKRETNAQHQLKNQLKEIDRALTKIKKDQEGLSGNALVAKMQEEVALQEQKKKILEQQLAIIKEQIQALIALYSAEFSKQFNIPINFVVDENGVANPDQIESALSKVAPEQEALAREMANSWMSTLNSLASNWSSLQSSIDSMSDSIDSLNKKMKETAEAEAFRVKEEKWYLEEQAIKRVEKELAKLQRIQKHLTGPALIKNLEQQQRLLEKQAEAQARKLSLMKGELQTMQAMLALQGVMFSEDGLIANYAEIAAQGNDKLTGYLKSYQSLYESIMDLEEGIQETFDKKLDLEYEKAAERLRMFNAKIDVELDLGKAKREWQNFKREFLNTLNGMQQLNDSLAEKAKQNLKDIMDISARETPMLTDHVNQIMNEIAVMQAGGWSDLYGDDQATALSDLANYRQQLQDSLSAIADKIKEVEESYLQQIQKIKGKFDEQLSNYEQIQSIIDHDMNLIKLLKGSEAYDQLTNYYDKSTKNYESEIQMLRNQVTYWENLMDQTQPGSKEWEEFQSNWKDALSKLNSAVDSAIQNLMDKYENLINKILSDMEKKFTGGVKLDYLKQQWDWANDEADLYLDKISQEYNIQKLTYKYQEAANKINDPTQRAKVLKIMDQELSKLKEKDKLTKYDVERANKIYDLRMKELELEDASQNKTKMRLRRDAEGNYRYEYVADQDKVAELKQDILDMEEEIRQFDLSSLREKKEESIKILQEFIDEARELTSMRREGEITEEEYEKRLEELKNHYKNMYDASADAIDNISNNLTESTTQEMIDLDMLLQEELDKMTKEAIDALVQDISPIYDDIINDMIDRIAGAGGFTEITREAMDSLVSVFYDFESELEAIELAADISFDTIISGIDETIDEMQALIEDNDELLTQYQEELDVIVALIDELHDLEDAYRAVYDAAMDAVDAALELRQTYLDNQDYEDVDVVASSRGSTAGLTKSNNPVSNTNKQSPKPSTGTGDQKYALTDTGKIIPIGSDQKWKDYFQGDLYQSGTLSANVGNTVTDKKWRIGDNRNLNITATGSKEELERWRDSIYGSAGGAGLVAMATGGYTGEWGSEGKIAMLHEKELVLNKEDTANILQAVNQTRQGSIGFDSALVSVMSQIGDTVSAIYSILLEKTASDMVSSAATAANISNTQANSVTNNINANFPNAGNMNEIKNALMSFSNYASQQTHLNKRINSATTANAYRQR